MRVNQSMFNVQVELSGSSQRMLVEFITPGDIGLSDFSLENIVIPAGSSIEVSNVVYVGPTENNRKIYGIGVYYTPPQLGISTYTLKIRNERYYITSTYAGVQASS